MTALFPVRFHACEGALFIERVQDYQHIQIESLQIHVCTNNQYWRICIACINPADYPPGRQGWLALVASTVPARGVRQGRFQTQ